MAEIVLFHHVQGLTAGVSEFAVELQNAGHTVHTPDLFDGRTFITIDDGMAYARTIGFGALLDNGVTAAEALSLKGGVVYAGFSLGGMPAQRLAQTSPNARGALLFHACVAVSEFSERWPNDVPVQIHAMDADPFFTEEGGDLDAARELVASTSLAELFLYRGNEHLFTDSSLPAYEPTQTRLLIQQTLTFLSSI